MVLRFQGWLLQKIKKLGIPQQNLQFEIPLFHASAIYKNYIMEEVRTAHLLIKHSGSRNPVSRRSGKNITIPPDIALQELQELEARIRDEGVETAFPKYARARSDCSSFSKNGDLGFFGKGMMQQPFEDASFALLIGEMSTIVSTDSGYHLIYRIG
jgi:peptidyl-prolyl cis-trans isomerase NIMA-interacting 1